MSAYHFCSPNVKFGPVIYDYITGFDLDQVSTLQPFADNIVKTRMGPPQQLHLSDLRDDCPRYTVTDRQRNLYGVHDKCNPVLEYDFHLFKGVPQAPEWKVCGRRHGGSFGIFDPPVPVTACHGGDGCGNVGAEKGTTTTVFSTALAQEQTTTSPTPVQTPDSGVPPTTSASPTTSSKATAKSEVSEPTKAVVHPPEDDTPPKDDNISTSPRPVDQKHNGQEGDPNQNQPGSTKAHDNVNHSKGSQQKPTKQAQFPSSDSGAEVPPNNAQRQSTTNPSPLQTTAIIAGQPIHISAVASQPSVIVVDSQTLTISGAVATLTNHQVISLASDGIIVQVPGGQISTIRLPATTTAPDSTTIAGNVVKITRLAQAADQGGKKDIVVVAGQTLSIGGEPKTIEGHQVVSLGSDGVVVQIPGGGKTTIAVPHPLPSVVVPTSVAVTSIVDVTISTSLNAAQGANTVQAAAAQNDDDTEIAMEGEQEAGQRNPPRPAPNPPSVTTAGVGQIVQSFYESGQVKATGRTHLEWWAGIFIVAIWVMGI